jgi:hypothetical protein
MFIQEREVFPPKVEKSVHKTPSPDLRTNLSHSITPRRPSYSLIRVVGVQHLPDPARVFPKPISCSSRNVKVPEIYILLLVNLNLGINVDPGNVKSSYGDSNLTPTFPFLEN